MIFILFFEGNQLELENYFGKKYANNSFSVWKVKKIKFHSQQLDDK